MDRAARESSSHPCGRYDSIICLGIIMGGNRSSQIGKFVGGECSTWIAAYVTVKSISTNPLKVGDALSLSVEVVNSGNTPAMNVVSDFVMGYSNSLENVVQTQAIEHTGSSSAVMTPNEPYTSYYPGTKIVDEKLVNLVNSGRVKLFVRGEINYLDVFNARHKTSVCMHFSRDAAIFHFCETGNFAE